jgi:hypothetical protein
VSTSGAGRQFGMPKRPRLSVAQLLAAKHTQPIQSLDDLTADTFESDEELEDFLAFTYAERHRDLARAPTVHPVILDTDVASQLHRRKLTGPLATRLVGREPLITFVTLGELTKWAEIRNWGTHRRSELASWLSGIPVLPGDEAVAEPKCGASYPQQPPAADGPGRSMTYGSQPAAWPTRFRSQP